MNVFARRCLNSDRHGVAAAQGDGHPPDLNRQWIAPAKNAAMGDFQNGPDIDAQRAQTMRLAGLKPVPSDRDDADRVSPWPVGQRFNAFGAHRQFDQVDKLIHRVAPKPRLIL